MEAGHETIHFVTKIVVVKYCNPVISIWILLWKSYSLLSSYAKKSLDVIIVRSEHVYIG